MPLSLRYFKTLFESLLPGHTPNGLEIPLAPNHPADFGFSVYWYCLARVLPQ